MSEVRPVSSSLDTPEGPLTLAIVDQSRTAYEYARDRADARLVSELNQGSRAKRIVNNIWKGSVAYDYYRQKYIREADNEISEAQNVLVHEADADRSARAHLATIQRFQSEYDETVHAEAGERKEVLAINSEVADALKDIIRRYVNGELDDDALREEKTRTIAAFRETHDSELLGQGRVSIDNTLAIAQAIKGAVEHGESLDRVMDGMKVISGEARSGVRTEAKYNAVDRIIEKVNSSRVGSLVQPETVVSAVTIAASIARFGTRSTASKATVAAATMGTAIVAAPAVVTIAAATAGAAVVAGLWAGVREGKRMKDERAQHMREMAQGKEFRSGGDRRQEMEETRYETAAAGDLAAALRARFSPESLETDDALQAALDQLSTVEARIKLSDSRKIDLVTYSAPAAVEEERWALDLARAQAKTVLDHRLEPDVRRSLGLDATATLDDILNERAEMFIGYTEHDIATKNSNFRRIGERAVRSAMVKGAVLGLVFGLAAQEGIAAASDTRAGLLEQAWRTDNMTFEGDHHQTLLHGLIHGDQVSYDVTTTSEREVITGTNTVVIGTEYDVESNLVHHGPSSTYEEYDFGDRGMISISDDHSLRTNGDGTVSLLDMDGNVTVADLEINPDGTLPQESIDILRNHGMMVEDLSYTIENSTSEVQTVSVHEYMENHQDSTLGIQRDLYYFNDTPPGCEGANSDLNELGLGWGGENGTGVTNDGGYQMSVATMTPDGSFENGVSVNWEEEARSGNLVLLVTPSPDMQTQPIVVPVNPDGTIDIEPGSPAAQFFSVEDGHAVINAAFVEAAQVTDVDASGTTHVNILATAPGTGDVTEVQDTVTVRYEETYPEYKITTDGYDENVSTTVAVPITEQVPIVEMVQDEVYTTVNEPVFTEVAPVVPVVPRRPLEMAESQRLDLTGAYYGGRYSSPAEAEVRRDETSPRLLGDSEASLEPLEELTWYRDLVRRKRGARYVEDIERLIAASPELSNIPPNLKSIVTIPVYAAGTAESTRIYNLLKAYAGQDADAVSRNLMLLHLNWPDDTMSDPDKKAMIDRTRAEVERARADFPDLKIATIESEWERKKYRKGAIGYISRRMNDTALLALHAAMYDGRLPSDRDVLIIRNDADAIGVNRNYLKLFQADAERYAEADILTGTTSFDSTKAHRLPGMVAAATFQGFLNTIAATREGIGHTAGANFGVRAATLAAVGGAGFSDYGGAGSDDVEIGLRIKGARGKGYPKALNPYARSSSSLYHSKSRRGGTGDRRISRRVTGARIDTDSDRQEALYRRGIPMSYAWNDGRFDRGGYAERDSDLSTAPEIDDNPKRYPDEVIERMRKDMEVSVQGYSVATVRTALTYTFAGLKSGASTGYVLHELGGGRYRLDFTDDGKKFLLNALTRDNKGRFDNYGNRKMRRLYGEAGKRERRAPRSPAPLFRV